LAELKNEWTYTDLLKANALLDMRADYDLASVMLDELDRKKKR